MRTAAFRADGFPEVPVALVDSGRVSLAPGLLALRWAGIGFVAADGVAARWAGFVAVDVVTRWAGFLTTRFAADGATADSAVPAVAIGLAAAARLAPGAAVARLATGALVPADEVEIALLVVCLAVPRVEVLAATVRSATGLAADAAPSAFLAPDLGAVLATTARLATGLADAAGLLDAADLADPAVRADATVWLDAAAPPDAALLARVVVLADALVLDAAVLAEVAVLSDAAVLLEAATRVAGRAADLAPLSASATAFDADLTATARLTAGLAEIDASVSFVAARFPVDAAIGFATAVVRLALGFAAGLATDGFFATVFVFEGTVPPG